MQRAIQIYEESSSKHRSLDKIREQAEEECLQQTKKVVKLSKSTLLRRINGGRSIHEAHEESKWLSKEETDAVVNYAIECAYRGFPLSHKRIKEHVDKIARVHWGDKFPEGGVGKQWTKCFISDHSDRLQAYWSHPLDRARARAVNPTTKEGFFELLETVIEGDGDDDRIEAECIYGGDESGFQKGIGQKERVFGPAGKKTQHQQRSGDRENITVIVTICGDGTALPPTVIFKGEGFQACWKQDNPANASLGYSKKGYTDGEIGQAWIESFDKETRAKARGRRRLLLVDGHNSHYTHAFLEYARTHRIEVVGYPSHSTHVYQGLDVVIFAAMKHNWSEARDRHERNGRTVDKTNFLAVYAEAHVKTLTPENIKSAFRKTGVIPLNPDVITEQMMAPSLETSTRSTLPIQQSSPIKAMSGMIRDYLDYQRLQTSVSMEASANESAGQLHDSPGPATSPFFVRAAVDELTTTSASFLTSLSPLKSTSTPPVFKTSTISPIKPTRYPHLLNSTALTAHKQELQIALRESEARDTARKESMIAMQAGVVLAGMYVDRAQAQVQAVEERKNKKGKKRLMGDTKAKWFSGNEFYNLCLADEQVREDDAAAKEQRRVQKEGRTVVLAAWKKKNEAIRERNEAKKVMFGDALKAWEAEKDAAKREKR